MGSNPVEVLKFFRVYLQLLIVNCDYNCDDHMSFRNIYDLITDSPSVLCVDSGFRGHLVGIY